MRRGNVIVTLVFGLLIVVMIGAVAAFLLGDAMPGAETWMSDDGPRIVALLAIAIVLGGAMLAAPPSLPSLVRGLFTWLLLALVLVAAYAYRDDMADAGRRILGALLPGHAVTDPATGTITVMRDGSRHYRIRARINDAPVDLMFDTGASALTLTDADARAAGIDPDRLTYNVPVSTANGITEVAAVRIETLAIDSLQLRDLRAFVARPGALEISLLGLSVLDRLSSWRVEGDRLILEP